MKKKPAKPAKVTKKTKAVPKKSLIEVVPDPTIEVEPEPEIAVIDKMPFERANEVFNVLHWSFHPQRVEGETDQRFVALWKLFLVVTGWDEDEFWDTWEAMQEDAVCPECAKENATKEKTNKSN